MFVTGLVLAAGVSRRLGQPKQLLAYRGSTLLGVTLDAARTFGFDQLVVTIGGAATQVREQVDLWATDVVENTRAIDGCSSSIVAALDVVDDRAAGLVLLLGDQPGIAPSTVADLIAGSSAAALAVCRYDDGLGHPFWFRRDTFDDLRALRGDKAVWKLLGSGRHPVSKVPAPGPVPIDVDTWDDYEVLLAQEAKAADDTGELRR